MSLQTLLNSGRLWRANSQQAAHQGTLSSGIEALDQLLLGGWPKAQISELLYTGQGIGELRLLLPTLKKLSDAQESKGWLTWVTPPLLPYPPALHSAGLEISQQLLLTPTEPKLALWATEQALKSGSSPAVIAWLEQQQELESKEIRRLQLAAEQGQSQLWLMRPASVAEQASPAACRLKLKACRSNAIEVECLKRRGGWAPPPIQVPVAEICHSATLSLDLQTTNPLGQLIQGPWQASAN